MTDQPADNFDPLLPLRPDADRGREPKLIPGRMGSRLYSMAALLERIESAFSDEHGDDSPQLRAAETRAQRLRLILDTAEYVIGVESIQMSQDDKADLIRRAYSNLFGYGPLDPLFDDPRVTTISIAGADHVYARYEHGALVDTGHPFDDEPHLRRILARLLMHAGAELREDEPYVEVGLTVNERPSAVNLVAPPIAYNLNADIRVHPRHALTLDELALAGVLSDEAAAWLRALVNSGHGFMVVGETESGKTTLVSALTRELPQPETLLAVERAGELRLPPEAARLTVRWPVGGEMGVSFGAQIEDALARSPGCLVLDEVRADEPLTIAPLLENPNPPRQIWTFRGVADSKRLQSALGMLARRADMTSGEALVHALYQRLPFVVTVARIRERIQLFSVAEWQPNPVSDYPDFVLLLQYQEGMARPTGRIPVHELPDIPS